MENKIVPGKLAAPCRYMIFNANGFHECAVFNAEDGVEPGELGVCCVWFNVAMSTSPRTIEIHRNEKTGVAGYASESNLPSIKFEEKYGVVREKDVPNICPRRLTFRQIDAKIRLLRSRVDWSRDIDVTRFRLRRG